MYWPPASYEVQQRGTEARKEIKWQVGDRRMNPHPVAPQFVQPLILSCFLRHACSRVDALSPVLRH